MAHLVKTVASLRSGIFVRPVGQQIIAAGHRAPTNNFARMMSRSVPLLPKGAAIPGVNTGDRFNTVPEGFLGGWKEHQEGIRKWWTNDNEDYDIRVLTPAHREGAIPLILNYFKEKPQADVYLLSSPEDAQNLAEAFFDSMVPYGISVGAFLKDSSELIFIAMIKHMEKGVQTPYITKDPRLHRFYDELMGDVYTDFGLKEYFYGGPLSAKPGFQNIGLLTEALRVIEYHSCTAYPRCNVAISGVSSYFAQLAMASNNYTATNEISYKSWIDPVTKEALFKDVPKPHTHMRSMLGVGFHGVY